MLGQSFVFGPFVLNPEAGTLLRQDVPVPIGYRAFRLLTAFLERPGDAPGLDHGPTLTVTSAGCPGTSGAFHPASRSTFAA